MGNWTRSMACSMAVMTVGAWVPAWGQDCIDERIAGQREVVIDLLDILDKQALVAEESVAELRRITRRSKSAQAHTALRSAQAHLDDVLKAVDAAEEELGELDEIRAFRHEVHVGDIGARRGGTNPCIRQCPPYAGPCTPRLMGEFPDFETTIDDMSGRPSHHSCDGMFPFLVSGTCGDGTQFIYEGGGFTEQVKYFDRNGAFMAQTYVNDVPFETCGTTTYWPEHVACAGVVEAVHCGTMFNVGEEVCMP